MRHRQSNPACRIQYDDIVLHCLLRLPRIGTTLLSLVILVLCVSTELCISPGLKNRHGH